MKKLFVILLTAVCCMQVAAQSRETDIARTFLAAKGKDARTLECKYKTSNVYVLSDRYAEAFAIVAARSFESVLGTPVLAWSVESSLEGADPGVLRSLASRYDEQIRAVKKNKKSFAPVSPLDYGLPDRVEPMLTRFTYAQGEPFNSLFPSVGGRKCVTGCGPVALAEVLSYYAYPAAALGQGSLTTPDGATRSYNLEDYAFRWDGSEDDLGQLLVRCGASLKARVSPEATSSTLSNFVSTLIVHWGYSPECTRVHDTSDGDLVALAMRDLAAGRPVIVADSGTHTFVCDGYDGEFLHLDYGWRGYCRGYYRAIILPGISGRLPFNEMVTGIRPSTQMEGTFKVRVTTSAPGQLDSLIRSLDPESDNIAFRISSIAVKGPVGGSDIALLRNMAGAVRDYHEGHGVLQQIDLSEASIVGNEPYHTRLAGNMSISGTRTRDGQTLNYNYDMSKISDKDWATILDWKLERNSSRLLSKGEDGKYYITFFAENDILGKYMFEDCESLLKVVLPSGLKEMRSYIFLNCRALDSVTGVPDNRDKNAFKGSGLENQ